MNVELTGKLYGSKLNKWNVFLSKANLKADLLTDSTVLIWENDQIIAAGSRYKNILKCIAVDERHRGEDLTATVLTQLRQDAFSEGIEHLFLYTKPENRNMFSSLFFYPIAQTDTILLMENRKNGIEEFLDSLPCNNRGPVVGCIVMNCNPFTLGHRYLAETASKECDSVYIFILSEEGSHFSANDRMEMAKAGTADLSNVTVLPTGPYMISSATFPTYFLKDSTDASSVQCELDVEIFTGFFAPKFSISRRYVGSEPFCPVTDKYNMTLKEMLPKSKIELREINRVQKNGTAISASLVRRLLMKGDIDAARKLLPETTFNYLQRNSLIQEEML